jgi:glycosyltransferase involved in cell wall biosynthesis
VGTGPEEEYLRSFNKEVGGNAEFLGYCTGLALHDFIRHARAVVLPSEWYENAPLSVLESYALGKPVIGARIGGIPEMVEVGETGWVFESRNVDDLADCLCSVASTSSSKLRLVGTNARRYVEQSFNRQRYIDSILELYSTLGVNT